MKDLSTLPNKDGFEFIAVLKNGNIVKTKVVKYEKGLHCFVEFNNSIGWLDLKNKIVDNLNKNRNERI